MLKEEVIDGKPHVLVPKEVWNEIWSIFDKITEMGE